MGGLDDWVDGIKDTFESMANTFSDDIVLKHPLKPGTSAEFRNYMEGQSLEDFTENFWKATLESFNNKDVNLNAEMVNYAERLRDAFPGREGAALGGSLSSVWRNPEAFGLHRGENEFLQKEGVNAPLPQKAATEEPGFNFSKPNVGFSLGG